MELIKDADPNVFYQLARNATHTNPKSAPHSALPSAGQTIGPDCRSQNLDQSGAIVLGNVESRSRTRRHRDQCVGSANRCRANQIPNTSRIGERNQSLVGVQTGRLVVADALDIGTDQLEFFFEPLIPPIQMIEAADLRFTLCCETGNHQTHRSA